MKTVGAFCSSKGSSGAPSGDPEEILSSEGSEDAETSPPCGASLLTRFTSKPKFSGY